MIGQVVERPADIGVSELTAKGNKRPIGETGKYINGLAFKPTDWGDDGLPIIRIQNLTDREKPMNRTTRAVDPVYVIQPGDLLVSWSATLDAFIWDREPAILNQHIFKVIPNTDVVSKKFLFYALRQAISEMAKTEHLHGSTMKHINRGPFLAHTVWVPPLALQKEIVSEIEKQFSRLDEAVASLQRVKANLKRYKIAVVKAAVEGCLVPTEAELACQRSSNYESGFELMNRIAGSRPDSTAKRLRQVQATPHPVNGWALAPLSAVAEVQLGQQRAPVHANAADPLPYVRAANVTWQGLDLTNVKSMGFPNPDRYRLKNGDVLLSEASGSANEVGKPAIWRDEIPGACYQKTLIRIRAHLPAALIPEFIYYAFLHTCLSGQFAKLAPGVGILHLTAERMLAWPFPLPPLAEQHRIVAEVDRRLSIVREVEAEVDANLKRAMKLRQSVLDKAFRPNA